MEQTLIKLKVAKKSDDGYFFKAGSIGQVVGGTLGKDIDFMPVKAWDEKGLPYHAINEVKFYAFALKEGEYEANVPMPSIEKYALNYPGSNMEKTDEFDAVTAILDDVYSDKDYKVDKDGNISKKAGLKYAFENHQTPSNDKITTDFPGDNVAGENDPGIKDNYKEDVAEKPAEKPILGPLTGKVEAIFKILGTTYPNNLGKNVSQSYDGAVGGSGTVKKNTYKSSDSAEKATKPILGPLKGKLEAIRNSIK